MSNSLQFIVMTTIAMIIAPTKLDGFTGWHITHDDSNDVTMGTNSFGDTKRFGSIQHAINFARKLVRDYNYTNIEPTVDINDDDA